MKRSVRSVEIGDHVTPLKRYFLLITDDDGYDPSTLGLVKFLQQVLIQPSLLACGPVSTPHYSISHDGEKWSVRGEGESTQ